MVLGKVRTAADANDEIIRFLLKMSKIGPEYAGKSGGNSFGVGKRGVGLLLLVFCRLFIPWLIVINVAELKSLQKK